MNKVLRINYNVENLIITPEERFFCGGIVRMQKSYRSVCVVNIFVCPHACWSFPKIIKTTVNDFMLQAFT